MAGIPLDAIKPVVMDVLQENPLDTFNSDSGTALLWVHMMHKVMKDGDKDNASDLLLSPSAYIAVHTLKKELLAGIRKKARTVRKKHNQITKRVCLKCTFTS